MKDETTITDNVVKFSLQNKKTGIVEVEVDVNAQSVRLNFNMGSFVEIKFDDFNKMSNRVNSIMERRS